MAKVTEKRPPRVGTCASCRLAIYEGDLMIWHRDAMHQTCHEAQRKAVEAWDKNVKEDTASRKNEPPE